MLKKNNKGFTLVELLAVITILAVLSLVAIAGVTRLVSKSKKEQRTQQEKTVSMAAESYMQANSVLLPKAIGETTRIPIKNLQDSNYLKDEVLDASGASCMENSYVVVYKETATKYVYVTHLYCGNEKVPEEEQKPSPEIEVKFYDIDADGKEVTSTESTDFLAKVADPKYRITIKGGTDASGSEYVIDGYSYSISVTMTDEYGNAEEREVFSSGSLSGNMSKRVIIPGDTSAGNISGSLKDYIDITKATNVTIYVVARNTEGVAYETMTSIDGNGTGGNSATYHDNVKPYCNENSITGQAKNDKDWYNKANYNKGVSRKITVTCEDGAGSGCVRDKYTKTWPNATKSSAEFDYIEVSDNAGNKSGEIPSCRVRVNVDIEPPVVSIDAYKKSATGGKLDNNSVLDGATKDSEEAKDDAVTIKSSQYTNLYDGWMNGKQYPNGIIYQVTITDNLYLASYQWETNAGNISSKSDSKYDKLSSDNAGGISKRDISNANEANCTNKKCTFNLTFSKANEIEDQGMRKGKLTVYDKAGNKVVYTIEANIDRTSPEGNDCKPTINYKLSTGGAYKGEWTNKDVISHIQGCYSDNLSGWSRFEYVYTKDKVKTAEDKITKYTAPDGIDGFVFTETGISKVKYKSCDKANNCGPDTDEIEIKVDKIAPTAPTSVKGCKKNGKGGADSCQNLPDVASNTWVNNYVLVTASGSTDAHSGLKEYVSTATGAISDKSRKTHAATKATDVAYRHVDSEGTSTVTYVACDVAGNCSEEVDFTAKIDVSPPSNPNVIAYGGKSTTERESTVLSSNQWYSGYARAKASGSIDTLSGKVYYLYAIDNSNIPSNSKGDSVDVDKQNKTTVYFKACDDVGNCTAAFASPVIALDRDAPANVGVNNPRTSCTNENFSVTLSGTDTISGIAGWAYSYDNSNYITYAGSADMASFTTTQFSTERNQTAYFRACDRAGNCSYTNTNICIDKTPPKCTRVAKKTDEKGDNYTIGDLTCKNIYTSAKCSDTGGSGCQSKMTYSTSGATSPATDTQADSRMVKAKGTSNVKWTVYDNAGNSTTCSSIKVVKGKKDADPACGCASYEYPCVKSSVSYKATKAKDCPSAQQVNKKYCGKGVYNTNTNLCCKFTTYYNSTCTSSTCQSYNTCCHQ